MRRYLSCFGLFSLPPLIVVSILSLLFQPLEGDLTRIGHFSERDFGWNSTQPALRIVQSGKSITKPDVLVLGDSFSAGNIWQSVWGQKTQQVFLTFHYRQAGCLENWVQYALAQPSAQTVILESVEREFINAFSTIKTCGKTQPIPLEIAANAFSTTRATFPPDWHLSQTLRTAWNGLKFGLRPENKVISALSINAAIIPSCANFSNRQADRLLYYAEDERKIHWKEADIQHAVENVLRIQQRLQASGKQFLFVLVPDKLSVYQHCLRTDAELAKRQRINIPQRLRNRGVQTPDLLTHFRRALPDVVDLYYPNNTHLSWQGYVLMANILAQTRFPASQLD